MSAARLPGVCSCGGASVSAACHRGRRCPDPHARARTSHKWGSPSLAFVCLVRAVPVGSALWPDLSGPSAGSCDAVQPPQPPREGFSTVVPVAAAIAPCRGRCNRGATARNAAHLACRAHSQPVGLGCSRRSRFRPVPDGRTALGRSGRSWRPVESVAAARTVAAIYIHACIYIYIYI